MKKFGVVELFAGIAGLAQGFAETDCFVIQGLLDNDPLAKDSFLLNFGDANYINGNIRSMLPRDFLNQIGENRPFAVLGCPPCQGMSAAGTRRKADSRNRLIYKFLEYIQFIQPTVFILENVPQVLELSNYRQLISDFAEAENYQIWSGILNCALYGLPQTRQRAVVIGYHARTGLIPTAPLPTHYGQTEIYSYSKMGMVSTKDSTTLETALGWYPFITRIRAANPKEEHERLLNLPPVITVKDALGDLPRANTEGARLEYSRPSSTEYQTMMRANSTQLTAHKAWGHSSKMKKRIEKIPEGSVQFARRDRGRSRRYFSQAYGRLHRRGFARTITGNFHNPGCGRFIHYSEHRTLTIREAARLQGFEDNTQLAGCPTDQRRIIGNAFPKPLARLIASQVRKDFLG